MKRGLYIHIPFCQDICTYCDFCKMYYDENKVNKYLNKIIIDIDNINDEIKSLYIGGGTPSSLSCGELEKLFIHLKRFNNIPFTFEANPENLTIDKIKILKKYNVNRVSLGVQTFNEKYIKLMNRHHNYDLVMEVINNLINEDINDINVDLIYGLPNQTIEELEKDINLFLSLKITHISTYCLMINDHTILKNKKYEEMDQSNARNLYDFIVTKLEQNQFYRYEVSNFSKKGYQSKHNLIYWHNEEYYGIGLGASSYINKQRITNTQSLDNYLKDKIIIENEKVNLEDEKFYYLMLGLRLVDGIDINDYKQKFNSDLLNEYKDKIDSLKNKKLVEIIDNRFRITKDNLFIMDYILRKLLF